MTSQLIFFCESSPTNKYENFTIICMHTTIDLYIILPVIIKPCQEFFAFPVRILCFPVTIRPNILRLVRVYKIIQLRQHNLLTKDTEMRWSITADSFVGKTPLKRRIYLEHQQNKQKILQSYQDVSKSLFQ